MAQPVSVEIDKVIITDDGKVFIFTDGSRIVIYSKPFLNLLNESKT